VNVIFGELLSVRLAQVFPPLLSLLAKSPDAVPETCPRKKECECMSCGAQGGAARHFGSVSVGVGMARLQDISFAHGLSRQLDGVLCANRELTAALHSLNLREAAEPSARIQVVKVGGCDGRDNLSPGFALLGVGALRPRTLRTSMQGLERKIRVHSPNLTRTWNSVGIDGIMVP
jgi:hypothetical protein